jgi:hypothetical protein
MCVTRVGFLCSVINVVSVFLQCFRVIFLENVSVEVKDDDDEIYTE